MEGYVGELRLVSEAVLAVSRQLSTRDALAVIVRSARTLVGARYAALGVPDDRGSFAEFVVAGMTQAEQRAIGPLPRQHGMLAALLKSGEPERLADIRQDPRFEGWSAAHPELTGFLGVPVKNGEDVLGIIFVANKRAGSFTARDEELLTLFAAHAAIALTNARLYERSREVSVLEERARLARELHDAVSQRMFSIRAHARAAEVLLAKDPARAAGELAAIAELGAQAHAELRAVIDGLAPPELDGLAESLRRYALLAERAHGIAVRVTAADVPELDARTQAAAFRVAQEALHNALRHSGASEISVTLSRTRSRVILEVADDGTGFDPGLASGGLGLASMRDRAAAVGGTLRVTSAPGAGTRVRLAVPA
ncbi:MAG TPA: GAF domain-containing sensor histidine kinase [Trebonia sp.]|nr:GAF domain-containing sensor histidine kinase [Trebonia sp.]